jgi:hypothetical protein
MNRGRKVKEPQWLLTWGLFRKVNESVNVCVFFAWLQVAVSQIQDFCSCFYVANYL